MKRARNCQNKIVRPKHERTDAVKAPRRPVRLILAAVVTCAGFLSISTVTGVARAAAATTDCPGPMGFIQSTDWTFTNNPTFREDLQVYPTQCGRDNAGNNQSDLTAAYIQMVQSAGAIAGTPSMSNQLVCHELFASNKPYYDLEPWRPDVGGVQTILDQCNPDPTTTVYGVGVENGSEVMDGVHKPPFVVALYDGSTSSLNVAQMGAPQDWVHSWGPGCTQDFNGGSRGKAAIMLPDCAGSGTAFWVRDQFWAYYEGNFWSTASTVVGYPYNNAHAWGPGLTQDFTGGSRGVNMLMKSNQTSVHDVMGAIRSYYIALGGAPGTMGYPTSDEYPWNGITRQDFQGGSILWDSTHGARLLPRTQQLVFYDKLATPGVYSGVNSIYVTGPNQYGVNASICVNTPGYATTVTGWWWAARTYVYTYAYGNCTGNHPTGTLWIDPDGSTQYRCLIDTAPYTDWSCKP